MAFPISAFAAGLGSVNVTSALGEPLNASIELLSITPAELASLQAKIDSEAAYMEQGLTRLAVHNEIKLRISKNAGNNILKLTSNSAIAEPVLDLLVVVEWSNGRISRQYTVLLDPPSYNPAASQTQAPVANQFNNASIKKTNGDIANKTQPSSLTSPGQEHLTKKGDTLYKIARRMQPAGVDLDKVLVALFEANPEAFDGKNMNRLKVGKILQAPSEDALNAMTNQHVNSEIKLQTADWNKYRNKLAEAVAQKVAQASNEDTQSSSGKINSAAEDKSASTDSTKDVVKLSTADTTEISANTQAKLTALQEEVSAREKGLKEAEDRTAALEKQIEDMQKLLALKNNTMLNAQEQSAQADTVAEAESSLEETKPSETSADTAKPQATAKKPAAAPPKSADPEANQPSFFASLLDTILDKFNSLNKTILLAIVGVLALLVVIWLFIRNKRSKQLQDFEQGIMTSGSLKASTVFGDSASGAVATGDTSFLTDFSHSTSNALIDTNDVDPIAEAEVYMAYGRDAQAEEILKDAISKEPQRYELHLKLLEMYASNKNTAAFETVAGEMFSALGADNPTWIKVAEIGAKLEPNNPLYQLKEAVIAKTAEANQADQAMEEESTPEPDMLAAQPPQPALAKSEPLKSESINNEAVDNELDASDFSDSPLAAEVDLDFSVADNTDASQQAVAGVDDSSAEMSFQHADEVVESNLDKDETALQFDLDKTDEASAAVKVKSDMPSLDFPTFATEKPVEAKVAETDIQFEVPSELTLDMPITAEVEAHKASLDSDEVNDDDDFDFGVDEDSSQNGLDTKSANILDVSSISLDISDEVSFATDSEVEEEETAIEEPMTPAYEEVETKLELVAAYIDMEDKDGAKELLEEVLKEGNFSQRKRADQILASLA